MVQEKPSPSLLFIIFGLFLVGAAAILSFLGAYFIALIYTDFSGNATLLTWNRIAYLSLPIVFIFSLSYFSRRQIKQIFSIHLVLVTLIILAITGIRVAEFNEQKQILQTYQQFIELVKSGKTTEANTFMHPEYQLTHERLDIRQHTWLESAMNTGSVSSTYAVHIESKNEAIIVPNPKTNQWYHPSQSAFLFLQKIDGEWYFTGDGGWFSAD